MKRLAIPLTLLGLILALGDATAKEPASVRAAANALNIQAKSQLGISVRALGLLVEADPKSFLLRASLIDNGSWKSLSELKLRGYVTINEIKAADGEYVQVILTAKGAEVQRALRQP